MFLSGSRIISFSFILQHAFAMHTRLPFVFHYLLVLYASSRHNNGLSPDNKKHPTDNRQIIREGRIFMPQNAHNCSFFVEAIGYLLIFITIGVRTGDSTRASLLLLDDRLSRFFCSPNLETPSCCWTMEDFRFSSLMRGSEKGLNHLVRNRWSFWQVYHALCLIWITYEVQTIAAVLYGAGKKS